MIDSYVRIFQFICWPMLVHRMTLVSFRLFRKHLGNLQNFWFHRLPWQKIARQYAYAKNAVNCERQLGSVRKVSNVALLKLIRNNCLHGVIELCRYISIMLWYISCHARYYENK